jgi:hypothetical protein
MSLTPRAQRWMTRFRSRRGGLRSLLRRRLARDRFRLSRSGRNPSFGELFSNTGAVECRCPAVRPARVSRGVPSGIARDAFKIPTAPVWFCRLSGHLGCLNELRRVDEERSGYPCRHCRWQGIRRGPWRRSGGWPSTSLWPLSPHSLGPGALSSESCPAPTPDRQTSEEDSGYPP